MSTIKKFEDLLIWQKARSLSFHIYKLSDNPIFNDKSLKYQIRRSGGSIMDNIAEGFERNGNAEFRQFLSISKGSAGELRSQLYRAKNQGYLTQDEFDEAYHKSLEISKMISSFITYIKKTPIKGAKYVAQEL